MSWISWRTPLHSTHMHTHEVVSLTIPTINSFEYSGKYHSAVLADRCNVTFGYCLNVSSVCLPSSSVKLVYPCIVTKRTKPNAFYNKKILKFGGLEVRSPRFWTRPPKRGREDGTGEANERCQPWKPGVRTFVHFYLWLKTPVSVDFTTTTNNNTKIYNTRIVKH